MAYNCRKWTICMIFCVLMECSECYTSSGKQDLILHALVDFFRVFIKRSYFELIKQLFNQINSGLQQLLIVYFGAVNCKVETHLIELKESTCIFYQQAVSIFKCCQNRLLEIVYHYHYFWLAAIPEKYFLYIIRGFHQLVELNGLVKQLNVF